jgi:hypothetical protein
MVASPVWQMCRKGMISVWQWGRIWRVNPLKVADPALPASTMVVTPACTAGEIRMDAASREAFEDVRMQIDEAGGDDLAPHVDGLGRLGRRDIRGNARDDPSLHRHVLGAAQSRGGIDDGAALEQEIVHGVPPSRCAGV